MKPDVTTNYDPAPELIVRLKRESSLVRRRILKAYLAIDAVPARPPYMDEPGITASHIIRSEMELEPRAPVSPPMLASRRAYTRDRVRGFELRTGTGSLTEVCMGVVGDALYTRAALQVAAGFFSSMVAAADDYLDCEGLFESCGEGLYYVSHAYRDLMDMALEEEALKGHISRTELFEIKRRLFNVIKTLIRSESSEGADEYLYEKSCGDRVVSVLATVSSAPAREADRLGAMARLVGEAGQIIDDAMDLDCDAANHRRNYIALKGLGINDALTEADARILAAREMAGETEPGGPISWILGSMKDVTRILREALSSGKRLSPSLMGLSAPLSYLLDEEATGVPASGLLIWF